MPLTYFTGISFSSCVECGALFMRTSYSLSPIFTVPEGMTTFCALTAFRISEGETPFDCIKFWLRLIITCRGLPPYG